MFEKYWQENGLRLPSHLKTLELSYKEIAEQTWNAALRGQELLFLADDLSKVLRGQYRGGGIYASIVFRPNYPNSANGINGKIRRYSPDRFTISTKQEIEETFGVKL